MLTGYVSATSGLIIWPSIYCSTRVSQVKSRDRETRHGTRTDIPRRKLAGLDVLVQGTRHKVGVIGSPLAGFGRGEVLVALVGLDVELDVLETAVLRDDVRQFVNTPNGW